MIDLGPTWLWLTLFGGVALLIFLCGLGAGALLF
jgi:hypothetical protein